MGGQRRRNVGCHGNIRRDGLSIACAFIVGTAPVYLKIGIGLLSAQYLAGTLSHARLNRQSILRWLLLLLLLGKKMSLRLGRREISLAVLEMLDLARCVFGANEAAMQTADFVTFRGRILVLELFKGSPYVRVGMSAHGGLLESGCLDDVMCIVYCVL